MTKKNFLIYTLIKVAIIVLFGGLLFVNAFQKLDYRLYDSYSHLKKEPELNENIMLLKIDDPSIRALGEWPWTRDVIADALLRMKEFDVDSAIFDIEYISPSKNGIAPAAEENVTSSILGTEDEVITLIDELTSSIESGYYTAEEVPMLADIMVNDNITQSFDSLTDYITHNISRDNDEYFAQALQFFGKTYLTINHQDMGYDVSDDEVEYIKNRFLLDSVNDNKNLVEIGNLETARKARETLGLTPALHKLINRCYGVSFTNSVVDSDGVRRRMELLYKYGDKYLPQLVFGPYLDIVKSTDITREKNSFIIHNATDPVTGEIKDIKIPVDKYGRILINWRHGACEESFKNDSIINLLELDIMEENINICLTNIFNQPIIGADGFEMEYTTEVNELMMLYDDIVSMKNQLLSQCTGYDENKNMLDGISDAEYEEYFKLRDTFFVKLSGFLQNNHLDKILQRLDELKELVPEDDLEQIASLDQIKEYMELDFSTLASEYETYTSNFNEMKPIYKDAYCIIGNTATSTTDNGATPFEEKFMNVGIHANILNTLLTEDFIKVIGWQLAFVVAVALSILMLSTSNLSSAFQNIFTAVVYVLYCVFFTLLFVLFDIYVPLMGSFFYLLTDLIASIALRFYHSTVEKKFITQIAASFANKDTVDELRKNPDAFKTEGQKKVITALFSDIQKFSTLSESIGKIYGAEGPNKLIEILNAYLGDMSNEILKNNGTIDKYEGDAIISMFGAPDPLGSHTKEQWAYLCLDSAIKMKKVEEEFNHNHADLFVPKEIEHNGVKEIVNLKPLQTRIGVNSGDAFVGLMGSKTESFSKLNYTMIGDTVNLASRLEGVNKAYNTWIMCSDATWNMANFGENEGKIVTRKLDRVRVVGRSTPVQLYNVLGFKEDISADQIEQIDIFHEALDKYLNREFVHAGKLFLQANELCGGDPTSVLYAKLCKEYSENGVSDDWDGVRTMESK